jgi:VWFA-related protein
MYRVLTGLFVIGALALSAPPSDAQSIERSMYVSVLDQSSQPVTGLGADAFVVREDGRSREVLRASPATAPIEMAILIDNSQAATSVITDLRRALGPFLTQMASKGHQIALIALADRPTILVDYTSSADRLQGAANRIFAQEGSGTLLLDGVVDVAYALEKRGAERRVIVVITTEGTDFSNLGFERTLEELGTSGAQMYAFIITEGPSANLTTEEARNRGIVLDRGPRITGGKREQLLTGMALTDALENLAAELNQQYHVVFARPDTTVPPDEVDIEVKQPGLTARGVLVRMKAPSGQSR